MDDTIVGATVKYLCLTQSYHQTSYTFRILIHHTKLLFKYLIYPLRVSSGFIWVSSLLPLLLHFSYYYIFIHRTPTSQYLEFFLLHKFHTVHIAVQTLLNVSYRIIKTKQRIILNDAQ